jgi:hypothetical protein
MAEGRNTSSKGNRSNETKRNKRVDVQLSSFRHSNRST